MMPLLYGTQLPCTAPCPAKYRLVRMTEGKYSVLFAARRRSHRTVNHMQLPRLAITMGDPAGIGPETIVRAWSEPEFQRCSQALVVGSAEVMRRAARRFAPGLTIVEIQAADEVSSNDQVLPCLDCVTAAAADVPAARIDARGGQAAYEALIRATQLARNREVQAIVTAPLNKAALHAAGHFYPGHTELLAELCGVRDFAMMLYLPPGDAVRSPGGLGVAHVTLHMALRDVFAQLSREAIISKARLADTMMRALLPTGASAPRIGVCALNPHAGEQGLFGDEEQRLIEPAVAAAQAQGLNVTGPLPSDTLMVKAADGHFDAVVAMYHDQGHIALKLLGLHRAVNITLGLPIIRTSVAHGTAFDLAWQGQARHESLIEAVRVAARLGRVKSEE
jgi:4-phospho-D-threonate 3-dehydrogenase / 4-phospho-D-erythronate 3-dehydrogenase